MLSYMSESAAVLMGEANGAAVCVTTSSQLVFTAKMKNMDPYLNTHTHSEQHKELETQFIASVQKRTVLRGLQPLPGWLPSNCIISFWRMRQKRVRGTSREKKRSNTELRSAAGRPVKS